MSNLWLTLKFCNKDNINDDEYNTEATVIEKTAKLLKTSYFDPNQLRTSYMSIII